MESACLFSCPEPCGRGAACACGKGAAAPTRKQGCGGAQRVRCAAARVSRLHGWKMLLDKYLFCTYNLLCGGDEMAKRYAKDRTERLNIRCSPMEKLELEQEAKKRNMTVSALLLGAALGAIAGVADAMKSENGNGKG